LAFGKGFTEALTEAMTPLDGIFEALTGIFNALTGLGKDKLYTDIAHGLGKAFGEAIMLGLHVVWTALLGAQHALESLPLLLEALKTMGDTKKYEDVQRRMDLLHERQAVQGEALKKSWGRLFGIEEKVPSPIVNPGSVLPSYGYGVKDAIITKRGEVVRVDPNDTIMAAKDPGRFGGNLEVNVNLYVTEGDARNAGTEFASGFEDQLRRSFLDSAVAGGH